MPQLRIDRAQITPSHEEGSSAPLTLKLHAHAADIHDRDGAGALLRASRPRWPFVKLAYADCGYPRPRVVAASSVCVEIVGKPGGQIGFVVHARRWVAERFFAWIV